MSTPTEAATQKLIDIQQQVRRLATEHPAIAKAMRKAYEKRTRRVRHQVESSKSKGGSPSPSHAAELSLRPEDLRELPDKDYLHVSLYVLGALADLGNPRPIVPVPASAKNRYFKSLQLVEYRSRFSMLTGSEGNSTAVDPELLTPSVAQSMLEAVIKRYMDRKPAGAQNEAASATPPLGHVDEPGGHRRSRSGCRRLGSAGACGW